MYSAVAPRGMEIYMLSPRRDAERTLIFEEDQMAVTLDWSPDERFLVYEKITESGLWLFPMEEDGAPRPLVPAGFSEGGAAISPDGKWLAFGSNESGEPNVYVQAFPDPASKYRISSAGGMWPVWRGDG